MNDPKPKESNEERARRRARTKAQARELLEAVADNPPLIIVGGSLRCAYCSFTARDRLEALRLEGHSARCLWRSVAGWVERHPAGGGPTP